MKAQMIRVISSPSSSTIGFLTLIFATERAILATASPSGRGHERPLAACFFVLARAALARVVALAAEHAVAPLLADQPVLAGAALERVRAAPSTEPVLAGEAEEGVLAVEPQDAVSACGALELVLPGGPDAVH